MEIHSSSKFQPPHLAPVKKIGASSRVDSAGGIPSDTSVNASPVRSSEIQQLTQRLRELPEGRNELVAMVKQRMLNGDYETRQAAEATAAAILK